MKASVLLLTLRDFSATGGIEKVSRIVGKMLHDEIDASGKGESLVYSMYDRDEDLDPKYLPAHQFRGFGENKIKFVIESVKAGKNASVVILSHINLLSVGYLIKLISPATKLVLIVHGIEVWEPFSGRRKRMLKKCDLIVAVSSFTKNTMRQLTGFSAEKFVVLNNCLDPFLPERLSDNKDPEMLKRYGFDKNHTIVMTLTRLSAKERYKGYDHVLHSIKDLITSYPGIRYLIVGKYDEEERHRLEIIIDELGIKPYVVFAGFVPDEELNKHYQLSDIYIMPSKKEGFGIVFIEALYYGKPVIAGNKDGSTDALRDGDFGLLVNPDDTAEITSSIVRVLSNRERYIPNHQQLLAHFSFDVYKSRWANLLDQLVKS